MALNFLLWIYLSATASAFQLALFVKDLAQGIKRFIGKTTTIPKPIQEVYDEVCDLELAVDGISEFSNPAETLQELSDVSPQLTGNTGKLQKVWLTFWWSKEQGLDVDNPNF
ncbi:hypothetical protein F4809DRAFT_639782 [Biscogniauxia mediterranea]|nr:hypothetical protein F4809DRAFT_639782 [Biscogniauxia mediterranea]